MNPTPSALVRNRWESSAVMVTACPHPCAPRSRPRRSSTEDSRSASCSIENDSVRAWLTSSPATRATFTLTPPISHPMELIPVLDLAHGVAVHAIGGDRSRYEPVRSELARGAEGDPMALAGAYRTLPGGVAMLRGRPRCHRRWSAATRTAASASVGPRFRWTAAARCRRALACHARATAGRVRRGRGGTRDAALVLRPGVAGPSCARHFQPRPPERHRARATGIARRGRRSQSRWRGRPSTPARAP